MNIRHLSEAAALTALILATPALAAAQEDTSPSVPSPAPLPAVPPTQSTPLNGIIVSHDGAQLVVRVSGVDMPMTLAPAAPVQQVIGVAGLRREDHPASDLIKGLTVTVDTVQAGGQTYATKVTFTGDALKTARAIAAGTEEAKQKIIAEQAENKRRLSESERRLSLVGQFSEKGQTRVYFDTGSAAINAEGRQNLQAIADKARSMPGALLRVVGHTDSTGSAATNQRLSAQRASAVTAYLLQQCSVPPEKIATAAGLGSYVPVEDEEPGAGSAQNRRVTVFVLVSKASEPADATQAAAP